VKRFWRQRGDPFEGELSRNWKKGGKQGGRRGTDGIITTATVDPQVATKKVIRLFDSGGKSEIVDDY